MKAILCCALALTAGAMPAAQGTPATPGAPAPPAQTVPLMVPEATAHDVREQLREVLYRYPPEVGRILKMDPTMLSNQPYLAQYPGLQQFLAVHPEITRNPAFYLDFVRLGSRTPETAEDRAVEMWNTLLEGVSVFAVMLLVVWTLAWLVQTVLNHRRWVRMSRVQTDVHNKLLDRFGSTNEVLTYVQTAAGRRFLEAAPIPAEQAGGRSVAAPLSRILWSVQAGIVLVVGGFGLQFVSGRVTPVMAEGLWTMGVLATAFGLGFVGAGFFSYVMSRRLGLLDPAPLTPSERGDASAD